MTEKTEAQPEALRLADRLEDFALALPAYGFDDRPPRQSAAELRRQHAEIQQLKARVHELEQMHDHSNLVVDAAKEHIASLEAQLSARQAAPDGQWKCGDEFLPYHPDASHVDPAYRDGWNDCYRAGTPPPEREPLSDDQWQALADALDGIINRELKDKISTILKLPTE